MSGCRSSCMVSPEPGTGKARLQPAARLPAGWSDRCMHTGNTPPSGQEDTPCGPETRFSRLQPWSCSALCTVAGRGPRRRATASRSSIPWPIPRTARRRAIPTAHCAIPAEAGPADVSTPDHVVGTGTPESCTAEAFIDAVAQGGIITFNCGPEPVTITLDRPAKVFNDADPDIVIDGGGLVTLDGGGVTRILYMNTCDPDQAWTTPHCDDQDHPAAHRPEPDLRRRQRAERDRVRRRRRHLGARRPVQGRQLPLLQQRAAPTTGPTWAAAAIRVFDQYQRPAGLRREQHLRRRRRATATWAPTAAASAASASPGPSSTACSPTTRRSATAATPRRPARRAAAAAAPSTTTATP